MALTDNQKTAFFECDKENNMLTIEAMSSYKQQICSAIDVKDNQVFSSSKAASDFLSAQRERELEELNPIQAELNAIYSQLKHKPCFDIIGTLSTNAEMNEEFDKEPDLGAYLYGANKYIRSADNKVYTLSLESYEFSESIKDKVNDEILIKFCNLNVHEDL